MINTILWDFNGTILDDVKESLQVMNTVLHDYAMPPIQDLDHYYTFFRFPLRAYYAALGFEGALYDGPANLWWKRYIAIQDSIPLRKGMEETLRTIQDMGLRQTIISSHKHDELLETLTKRNMTEYFHAIIGTDDIHAKSKIELAKQYMQKHAISPKETLMVGDTMHDVEVANALGCPVVIFSGGHQPATLFKEVCPVLEDVCDLLGLIDKANR